MLTSGFATGQITFDPDGDLVLILPFPTEKATSEGHST
jgi:hypothetical protein